MFREKSPYVNTRAISAVKCGGYLGSSTLDLPRALFRQIVRCRQGCSTVIFRAIESSQVSDIPKYEYPFDLEQFLLECNLPEALS